MSVLRRPPRELRFLLTAVLCLVFTCALFAQSEVMPVSTSESVESSQSATANNVPTVPEDGSKAIAVEVSPAEEVAVKTDESSAIVMPEVIPSSNTESEPKTSADPIEKDSQNPIANKIENIISEKVNENIDKAVDNVNKSVSEVIKEAAPVISDVKQEAVTEVKEAISNVAPDTASNKTPEEQNVVAEQVPQANVATSEQAAQTGVVTPSQIPSAEAKVEVSEKGLAEGSEAISTNDAEKGLIEGAEAVSAVKAEEKVEEKDNTSINKQNAVPIVAALADNPDNSDNPEKTEEKTWFEFSRFPTLAVILILLGFVSYYTFQAQRGKEMFIRRISGLSAIEDAVGRATEMGRGVLYVPGIMDMDDIQTIAGVTILGHVARKTAEYDTDLYAPMTRSFVMSVAQEVVKQAYMEKGRIDAYRPDRINYLTDDQFGYVAGVGGVMMRDKPAACFYLGTFYAESLILAETGNSIGAIQIAGTAEPSQIPFFVAACDYTLIGEELFAASAYLSKNPREIGSLKGQDMVKVVIIIAIVVGTLLSTIAATDIGKEYGFDEAAKTFLKYLK